MSKLPNFKKGGVRGWDWDFIFKLLPELASQPVLWNTADKIYGIVESFF